MEAGPPVGAAAQPDPALQGGRPGGGQRGVDVPEQPGPGPVPGLEQADDVAPAGGERGLERRGEVPGRPGRPGRARRAVDDDPHPPGVAVSRLPDGPQPLGIVRRHDRQDLDPRMVQGGEPVERRPQPPAGATGRHDQRERGGRRPVRGGVLDRGRRPRPPPGVQGAADARGRDPGEPEGDQRQPGQAGRRCGAGPTRTGRGVAVGAAGGDGADRWLGRRRHRAVGGGGRGLIVRRRGGRRRGRARRQRRADHESESEADRTAPQQASSDPVPGAAPGARRPGVLFRQVALLPPARPHTALGTGPPRPGPAR